MKLCFVYLLLALSVTSVTKRYVNKVVRDHSSVTDDALEQIMNSTSVGLLIKSFIELMKRGLSLFFSHALTEHHLWEYHL